jgi:hypothetical protein
MAKKILPLFVLITLAAGLLSYKVGSAPVAHANGQVTPQDASELTVPLTLPTAPATWSLYYWGGAGAVASVTKPARGAGVKHVATCISVNFSVSSPGGSDIGQNFRLLDGSTPVLYWHVQAPVAGDTATVSLCDLNVVGSANTPMTLGFGGAYSYDVEAVNLVGYDAQ